MDATASVPHGQSTFFFRFVQATTLVSLLCLVSLTIDFVLYPFDPPANGAFPTVFRIVYMLLLMPATLLIAFLIVRRVPDNLIGWFLLNWGCNLSFVAMRIGLDPFWDVMKSVVGNGIGWISLLYILLLFPDGIAFPRRLHPWLMLSYMLIVCSYGLFTLSSPFTMTTDLGDANPLFIPALEPLNAIPMQLANVLGLQLILLLPLAFFRFRRADAAARRKLKWLTFSVGIFVALLIPGTVYRALTGDLLESVEFGVLFYSFILAFPAIATGYAILKHDLYSIDVVINRTLVYGLLITGIFVLYAALIGGWGRLVGTNSSFEVSLIGAGVIALVYQPFRAFIQRAVNRLMFGRRNEPMTVIDQLGKDLEAALSSETALYHLVKTTAETLKLPYTAVVSDTREAVSFGRELGEPCSFR